MTNYDTSEKQSTSGNIVNTIVIIGAGLSGLVAADALRTISAPYRREIHVLEARNRVGGRLLSIELPQSPMIDLGATWIWPQENPQLDKLASMLHVHKISEGGGAYRFEGGSQTLANKLAESLHANDNVSLHLQCKVQSISKSLSTDRIKVSFHDNSSRQGKKIIADTVFIACPLRLAQEQISFEPLLDDKLTAAMASSRTWMAQQGKFVVAYESAFWKTSHRLYWERANIDGPLDVIFEHGNAIWGFLSNKKRWRSLEKAERKNQVLLQLRDILGDQAMSPIATFEQDWSREDSTCSALDATEEQPWKHPVYSNHTLFSRGYWKSSLWFIGSETSSTNGGFMEGAVEAASSRVQQYISSTNGNQEF